MVKNYKCPGCGAAMEFDSKSQKMKCAYCDTQLTVEELDALTKDSQNEGNHNFETKGEFDPANGKKEDFHIYKCSSCGAEVMTDANTAATFCSFCGNPGIMKDRVEGEQTPDGIIPFKIARDQAVEIYKAWTKKGLFTPSSFRTQTIIEKITGIYVPFWLFDYGAEADIVAHCTRVHEERHGNTIYTHTDNFRVTRKVAANYSHIPADASEKMPDDTMDLMEPFDYGDMTKFEMPYLSGYYAEKYNYTRDEMAPRAESRVKDYINATAKSTIIGYTTTVVTQSNTTLQRGAAKYTMFPVWVLNYSYKGKNYNFTLNGQTGKIVGKLPISKAKALACFGIVGAIAFTALTLIGGVFG